MNKIRFFFKKALTPVTIMVIPHENLRSLNFKVPTIGIFSALLLSGIGGGYILSLALNGLQYPSLVGTVDFYSRQFSQWHSTVANLREAEEDFRRIFSLQSKERILEAIDTYHSGSVDIQTLMTDLQESVETVDEIKDYLRVQRDIFMATPRGYPVNGRTTSRFGDRENPFSKMPDFHPGVDIAASPGTGIQATADGVVSYSGWTRNSGYVVVLEHGLGFSTVYAHNRKNAVSVGQRVSRGDTVGFVGSTGKSTGPHVHYEVWENGRRVDPDGFLQGGA